MRKTLLILGVVFLLLAIGADVWFSRENKFFAIDNNQIGLEPDEYIVPSKYKDIKVKTINEQSDDEQHRYTLHASWPVTDNDTINQTVENFSNNFIEEYRTRSVEIEASRLEYMAETGEDGVTFHADYNLSFDVAFASDDYLAFAFTRYRNTGNTGTQEAATMIFNRQSGEEVPVANLFVSNDYLNRLSDLVREDLYARVNKEAPESEFESREEKERWINNMQKMIDNGTEPTAENFKSLVINDEGKMAVYLDRYQAAPGYWGVLEIDLPLESFIEYLTPPVLEIFNLENKPSEQAAPEEQPVANDRTSNDNVNCTIDKCIALTFDDGPSVYTEGLLKTLVNKGVKATFFMLGSHAKVQQQTVIDVSKAGMEIGNHTWDHKQLTKLDEAGVDSEINDTRSLLEKITGKSVAQLRPPYGSFNDTVKQIANGPIILWNVDTEDWKHRDSAYIKNYVATHAKPGAIILMHDIHPTTVEAVPTMVDELKQAGYTLVTVSELFGGHLVTGKIYSGR